MKTTELAKRLGVSCMTVRRMAADRRIPGAKSTNGGHHYFPETEKFIAWLERAQAAKSGQAKEEGKRRREKLRARNEVLKTIGYPLPALSGPEQKAQLQSALAWKGDALDRLFAECSHSMEKAYGAMLAHRHVGRWPASRRASLLKHLTPLESIANALRTP